MHVLKKQLTQMQEVHVASSSATGSRTAYGLLVFGLLLLVFVAEQATAGSREQAKRMHERLTGVTPTEAVLQQMVSLIDNNQAETAARIAMDHEAFYAVTIKNWAAPWTNRDQDVFVPLNDYIATVIGLVRDGDTGADFRELLYGDVAYISTQANANYSPANNNHYEEIEDEGLSMGSTSTFVRRTQSELNPELPAEATAGVMTSRAAAKAFFIAGTNRAMFRFTLLNHTCRDLEQVQDGSRSPDRIRQDVSRSPGGDSRVFLNNCITCHSGMDPLAQAFAYYDYEFPGEDVEAGSIRYNAAGETDPATGTRVESKYFNNNTTFPFGFVTPNDNWSNYWRNGRNSLLGWDANLTGSGSGAKSMGMELAHSQAFAQCQVEKAFSAVCLREPGNAADRTRVSSILSDIAGNNGVINMKQVFAQTADYCKGN